MESKSEFLAVSWIAIVATFASGFVLADGINAWRSGENAAVHFFLAVMFALIARSDARVSIGSGTYRRRFLSWRRDVE